MAKKRLLYMGAVAGAIAALLCIRLIYISAVHGGAYQTMASAQRQRYIPVKYKRGDISDRNGDVFTDVDREEAHLLKDGRISKLKENSVFSFWTKKRDSMLAKHLIGYTGMENQGLSGLEQGFDELLKSDSRDILCYSADAMGRAIDDFYIKEDKTDIKSELRLTLDKKIQAAAEEVMDKHIKSGACVILDVESFDVLAMVSRPDFDTANIENYLKSEKGELLNRAVMPYSAGSVFKIIGAASALELGCDVQNRGFDCRGVFDLGDGHIFSCHKSGGHGMIDLNTAFAKSCNCTFYLLGIESGAKALMSKAEKFGLGQGLLNVNIGEYSGNLPKRAQYSMAEILNLSIGQGELLITPLQCAAVAATVANGGIRRDVNIVDYAIDSAGVREDMRRKNSYKVISAQGADKLKHMMRLCVTDGTASAKISGDLDFAGKTGSAETGQVKNKKSVVHGWFCGFFPYNSPKYAMALFSEGGMSGAESCVVPFYELAEKIIKIYPQE